MAVIRPTDLPAAASVADTVALVVDTGATVQKATPTQVVDAAIPLASQAEAEAGADNTKRMTPLRVKQAMDANMATTAALASPDGAGMVGVELLGEATDVEASLAALVESRVNLAFTGLALDGTDESAAAQAVFETHKGRPLLIPAGKVLCAAGIYMNGSTWDGTDLLIEGEFKLAPAPDAVTNNGSGHVWAGIEVRDAEVTINGYFDGNRAAQQDREQTICIAQAGGKITSGFLKFREVRGDGLYITQVDYNVASDDPEFDLGTVIGINTADDGRNLMSVISCSRGAIGVFVSRNIGGVVNGTLMPGGFDAEPNYSGQRVKNLSIGVLDIVGAGQSNIQLFGARWQDAAKTIAEPNIFSANINIGSARVRSTIAPTVADGNANVTISPYACCLIEGVADVSIGFLDCEFTQAYGIPLNIRNGGRNIRIRGRGKKVRYASFGQGVGNDERGLTDCDIIFDCDDIANVGHYLGTVENSRIGGKLTNPSTAYYSNRFGVTTLPVGTTGVGSIDGTVLCHEIPSDANWTRTFRHTAGVTYVGARIEGVRLPGTTFASELAKVGDMPIMWEGVQGITSRSSIPTGGYFLTGQVVVNTSAATAGQAAYWLRLTDGTSHTLGTHWKAVGTPSSAITAPTGGATIDAEARTAINSIRSALTAYGITA